MSEDLLGGGRSAAEGAGAPGRLSAAKLAFTFATATTDRLPRSLRTRLPILIAVVVAGVLTTATYAELQSVGRGVEQNLVETADSTALAVVDDLAARGASFDAADVRDRLHELIAANGALQSISIVEVDASGTSLLTSTSSEAAEDMLALGNRAVMVSELQRERQPQITMVARPLTLAGRRLAVVATVAMTSVAQIETHGRTVLFWFALPTIAVVTLLIDAVMRRLIHKPVGELRDTIERVSAGDLSSRAKVFRPDELGTVAVGLNGMLEQLDRVNDVLVQNVADRTSELRQRNAELEESNQRMLVLREALTRAERMAAVGQMAASVAHQVGTPLNLVSGYVQMIREDRHTDPAVKERLRTVETQLDQVTHVLRTVLDRARQPPSRQPIGATALVERVCTIARPRLARSGIALETTQTGNLGEISGDGAQLEIALLSLVTNAIDAMPNGGRLRIRGTVVAWMVHLEISDTGNGIPPELMPRLFDPWVTTKPEGRGTGLGLGIVREVIHTHGGRVTAQSAPGEGATFVIELPLITRAASSDTTHGPDSPRVPHHAD